MLRISGPDVLPVFLHGYLYAEYERLSARCPTSALAQSRSVGTQTFTTAIQYIKTINMPDCLRFRYMRNVILFACGASSRPGLGWLFIRDFNMILFQELGLSPVIKMMKSIKITVLHKVADILPPYVNLVAWCSGCRPEPSHLSLQPHQETKKIEKIVQQSS
jgi:hypothetical protein